MVLVYGWVLGQRLLRQRDKAGGVVVHNLSDLLATFMYAIVVGELLLQPTRRGTSRHPIRIFHQYFLDFISNGSWAWGEQF